MARQPRNEMEAGVFHVYARGNEKQAIFRTPADCEIYVRRLAVVSGRQRWRCLAYCLMPNHVHLLLETVTPNMGEGMRLLHGVYAQGFNRRHRRSGHLFQGRFGSVAVTDDAQLATTVSYIAVNPVSAGLVARPEAWGWGSHRAVARRQVPAWLAIERLEDLLAGAFGGDGATRYGELVAGRLATGVTATASETTTGAGGASVVL